MAFASYLSGLATALGGSRTLTVISNIIAQQQEIKIFKERLNTVQIRSVTNTGKDRDT